MLKNLFGEGASVGITQVLMALVLVLVLAALIIFLLRYLSGSRLGRHLSRGRQPRLSVLEAANVDGRRKLVIVRRDAVEHLIMIGGPNDLLIEAGFQRGHAPRDEMKNAPRDERTADMVPVPQAAPQQPPREPVPHPSAARPEQPRMPAMPPHAQPAARPPQPQAAQPAPVQHMPPVPQPVRQPLPVQPQPAPQRPQSAAPQPAPQPPQSNSDRLDQEMANLLGRIPPGTGQ